MSLIRKLKQHSARFLVGIVSAFLFLLLLGCLIDQFHDFRVVSMCGGQPSSLTLVRTPLGGLCIEEDGRPTFMFRNLIFKRVTGLKWIDNSSILAFHQFLNENKFWNHPSLFFENEMQNYCSCGSDIVFVSGLDNILMRKVEGVTDSPYVSKVVSRFYNTCRVQYSYEPPI